MKKDKFYITTSIIYANARPHIGFALELLQADAIARWQRLLGKEVYFLTGTDEHGTKVYQAAKTAGQTPRKFVNENAAAVKNLIKKLNISNDDFIRTSDKKRHWPTAQKIWQKLEKRGDIYAGHYRGLYSLTDEAYLTKSEAALPQYENSKIIELDEENYLFALSRCSQPLIAALKNDLQIIPEHRATEILNFIKSGLNDISFSRPKDKLPWGVPVPDDASQIMYVWCDALTNYLSALDYAKNSAKFKRFWPPDLQVIGKDILRFHAAIWPAMLLEAGLKLPEKLLVHGHISSEGKKMSKSLGNVVDPLTIIKTYGAEALRYYLLREISTIEDGDYSAKRFRGLYQADLANTLGNLVNRVLVLAGQIKLKRSAAAQELIQATWNEFNKQIGCYRLDLALKAIWLTLQKLNQYIDQEKPWALIKTNSSQAGEVIYNLLEALRQVSIMIYPFLPETSNKIRQQLGLKPINEKRFNLAREKKWGSAAFTRLTKRPVILFPRV
jgi:methionyl-tRNA synthetase